MRQILLLTATAAMLLFASASTAQSGWRMDPRPLSSSELMSPGTLPAGEGRNRAKRCHWVRSSLVPHNRVYNEAAAHYRIPARLLATVVLNELGDIGYADVAMDQILYRNGCNYARVMNDPNSVIFRTKPFGEHSFGIAQITPKTAMKYGALRLPPASSLRGEERSFYAACRLLDRRTSIWAAAKIVRSILQRMERESFNPLIQRNVRPGQSFSAARPYAALLPLASESSMRQKAHTILMEREKKLAELVAMTYNSDRALTMSEKEARDPRYYTAAKTHGENAGHIALDLYETNRCDTGLARWRQTLVADRKHGRQPAPKPRTDYAALRACLCNCNAVGTNFSCSFDTKDKGWSPSCRAIANGNCICKANGCFRKPPVTSGKCYNKCVEKNGKP